MSSEVLSEARQHAAAGRFDEAVRCFRIALQADPTNVDTLVSLGTTLRNLGAYERAETRLREAIGLAPLHPVAWHDLGTTLQLAGDLAGAVDAYRQALELEPGYLSGWCNLGCAAYQQGDLATARQAFDRALALDASSLHARLGQLVGCLEVVYEDDAEIERCRRRYTETLSELVEHGAGAAPAIAAATAIGVVQPFLLPYQGRNDRELQRRYGDWLARLAAAARPHAAIRRPVPEQAADGRYRIGIVSAYFRSHSNWKIPIRGWVEGLDRARFEVFGYHVSAQADDDTALAEALCDHFVRGPQALDAWVERIRTDQLHALIFPEFGMDPTTLQLGCLRLAPVQATSWGHPQTSGLPTIDTFLSSEPMEPADGERFYTEALVRLPGLSTRYRPPAIEPAATTRASLGTGDGDVLFWCCQSVFKYLPRHDAVFPRIAEGAPASRFLFIAARDAAVQAKFRARLAAAFAARGLDADHHCRFLPALDPPAFAGVTEQADVFLDSIGWSGCNSTLEAIARDLPVVTLPGDSMRSRHSAAILAELGLDELVADSVDAYVALAVRLAGEPALRTDTRSRIAAAKGALFDDDRPVRALERFLRAAIERRRREPLRTGELLAGARQAHQDGAQLDAELAYRELLAFEPAHPDALHGFGVLALQTDRPALARDLMRRVLADHPGSLQTLLALAELNAREHRYELALARYRDALAIDPSLAPAQLGAGQAALFLGEPDTARDHARRAVAAAPEDAAAQRLLGASEQALERYGAAAEAYRRSLRLANAGYALHVAGPPVPEHGSPPPLATGTVEVGGLGFPAIPPVDDPETSRPFWSVVIPVCKRRRYLLECLESVLRVWPGPEHMEIIVVDNGSDPPMEELVEAIGGGIVRYRRHPETIPLQQNWNSCVAACRGQWIHVLHDDDTIKPRFYRRLRSALSRCPDSVGAAFTAYDLIGPFGEFRATGRPYPGPRGVARDWLEFIGLGNVLNPPCMVIRRDAYERLGGYSEEILYTTDWELYKRVASFHDWWHEPDPLTRYRQHPVNITAEQNKAGAQGHSIRRSVEMSVHYLPEALRDRVTEAARDNYFDWCVAHLDAPVAAGNLDGAMRLLAEALKLQRTDAALERLFVALGNELHAPLRARIVEACRGVPAFRNALSADPAVADRLFEALLDAAAPELRRDVAAAIVTTLSAL